MHKHDSAVLYMLLMVHKLSKLAAAVEVPHLELPIVAASQQATLMTIQGHCCKAPIALAMLEVPFLSACVDVPHADSAAFIPTDDLQNERLALWGTGA